ncbi:hypothetical protein [Psychrobacillus sp. FJAT-21963]|uniref:hypothetical protein n=1 Tax=Psychrobacillus sp. FJAT-21963 TaxID=1712028 RepID=UPI0006FF5F6C|nr:hypothetical protein [Psychrobacillus sp. FJAT-21963]KQL36084.1 hypothetical protein AN959_09405 [Psychrobacillus sp. FJAT-21963]
MFDKYKKLFKYDEQNNIDDRYVLIPVSTINEELTKNIVELEKLGEELTMVLQRKYAKVFENQGKTNLSIWISRDIDGDEIEDSTSEKCLVKEYRSQIAIDYDGQKLNEDIYAETICLWYYFGGYLKGSGTLYDLSKNNLEEDIEKALVMLLN